MFTVDISYISIIIATSIGIGMTNDGQTCSGYQSRGRLSARTEPFEVNTTFVALATASNCANILSWGFWFVRGVWSEIYGRVMHSFLFVYQPTHESPPRTLLGYWRMFPRLRSRRGFTTARKMVVDRADPGSQVLSGVCAAR